MASLNNVPIAINLGMGNSFLALDFTFGLSLDMKCNMAAFCATLS